MHWRGQLWTEYDVFPFNLPIPLVAVLLSGDIGWWGCAIRIGRSTLAVCPSVMLVLHLLLLAIQPQASGPRDAQDDPRETLGRITCSDGYRAVVFAEGLRSPDGMTFDREGRLCVVEEVAGCVSRFDALGRKTVLATELQSPEGLCLGPAGKLLVVEDVLDGRLLSISEGGEVQVLAEHLVGSEGVLFFNEKIYLTQSDLEHAESKLTARTSVSVLEPEEQGWGEPRPLISVGLPFSFSELLGGGPEFLLVANETAGVIVPGGLMRLDLGKAELTLFAGGLVAPEGLAETPGDQGPFPVYVAEEKVDGEGHGRISCIDADGRRTDFATGFGMIEDVLVSPGGHIFVTEDSTGMVIELIPKD